MHVARYFSLRSKYDQREPRLPGWIMAALAALTVLGLLVDLGRL